MARQARLRSSTARRSKPLGKRNGGPSRKTLAAFACGQKGPRRRAEAACFDTPAGGLGGGRPTEVLHSDTGCPARRLLRA